jgi:hypothetical protein
MAGGSGRGTRRRSGLSRGIHVDVGGIAVDPRCHPHIDANLDAHHDTYGGFDLRTNDCLENIRRIHFGNSIRAGAG